MGKTIDYEEISKRIPVTKIIVKDLMKGTYREGHTTPINWEPEPPVPEQKKFPRKEIITIILFVLIIGSTAIIAKIISKKLSAKKEIAEQPVLPAQPTRQFYSQKIPIQRPSIPVQVSNRKQYSGKEKIYTWTEKGIHHYTNLKDVAESKNAVELK